MGNSEHHLLSQIKPENTAKLMGSKSLVNNQFGYFYSLNSGKFYDNPASLCD
ncbi:hypothetical protein SAMN05216464_11862 [Mucilaginibacter pineti]|uniref:Uncharacterized protein n=1 Tax=Mucilaginibacter pineti TaxID=1391627 RepID=A0A1G7L8C8_9SPHI|nr:hypothetical protein SAMN05216464_11862 [Mucilaginibacter pineti]